MLDGGKVRRANDPHLPWRAICPPRRAAVRHARQDAPPAGPAFRTSIANLFNAGQLDQASYNRAKNGYNGIKRAYKSATGTRKTNRRPCSTRRTTCRAAASSRPSG